jgi:hypothetical protein
MRHFLIHYDSFTKLKWLYANTAEFTFTLGIKLIQGNTFCIMTRIYLNILNTVKKFVLFPKVRISKQL